MYRRLIASALIGSAVLCHGSAQAEDAFPNRPIRMIVPQSAGSGGDVVARLIGDRLSQDLGQSIVVDNRPGANGIVAMTTVAKAQPDGYTVLLAGVSQISFNPHLYASLPYNPQNDYTFISPVVDTPFVLVASKASGITSVQSFVDKARHKPGGLTFSSAGVGNSTHLAMEVVAEKLGLKMTHAAYKGSGPALTGVVAGEVDAMVSVLAAALPQVTGGTVVPLAIIGQQRVKELPNVPTLKEAGIDVPLMPSWYALVGPAGMDPRTVSKLNAAVQAALADPRFKTKLSALYLYPVVGSSDAIRQRAMSESKIWGEFIRKRGIQSS
ncbi:Bug family tripartite tricarboxylate transporter substrate binding protein [Cupriavidus necator]|uniref:Tripartite tricarboxylate transporter substrate binding protein n=1 Tax=Cupriavidus necator TaxID=106590 RepID=A0A367PCN2_CUPNE|nr:tripartite tricarboxylate transporter substrate binding protein [Cupriavidus necator]RCJ05620.1 tripartite tricarboxylate transporter substrate binding protein [Cupriavidus necator]